MTPGERDDVKECGSLSHDVQAEAAFGVGDLINEMLVDTPVREIVGEGPYSAELQEIFAELVEYVMLFCRLVPVGGGVTRGYG